MTPLEQKIHRLEDQGVAPDILSRLSRFVQEAPPAALIKMSPPRLARKWGLDSDRLLEAFLLATREGMFDLEWDVRCPSCTGSTQLVRHLDTLSSRSACGYCRLDIEAGFDDAVEVTFRVNPSVRELGEVSIREVVQLAVEMDPPTSLAAPAQASVELCLPLVAGTWHLFSTATGACTPLRVQGPSTAEERRVEIAFDGANLFLAEQAWVVAPGPVRLVLRNSSAAPAAIQLARGREQPWLSGARVACHQLFRDMFSSELIKADASFSVRSVAFVFTDVKGSTALYERLGDSRAYALIKEHFRIMTRVIRAHRGAIVKTIGDAVMATFLTQQDAIASVFAMQQAFDAFNAQAQTRQEIVIKVGVHAGPCIAVTSNDRLDYFGRTVNIAARVQSLSQGGDIVVSRSLAEEAGIRDAIGAAGWRSRPFEAELKGIEGSYPVVELTRDR